MSKNSHLKATPANRSIHVSQTKTSSSTNPQVSQNFNHQGSTKVLDNAQLLNHRGQVPHNQSLKQKQTLNSPNSQYDHKYKPSKAPFDNSRAHQEDAVSYQSTDADYVTISDSDDTFSESDSGEYSDNSSGSSSRLDRDHEESLSESDLSSISNMSETMSLSSQEDHNSKATRSKSQEHSHQQPHTPRTGTFPNIPNASAHYNKHPQYVPAEKALGSQNKRNLKNSHTRQLPLHLSNKYNRNSYPEDGPSHRRLGSYGPVSSGVPHGIHQGPRRYYQPQPYGLRHSQTYGPPQRHFCSQSTQISSHLTAQMIAPVLSQYQPYPGLSNQHSVAGFPPGTQLGSNVPAATLSLAQASQGLGTTHYHINHHHYYPLPNAPSGIPTLDAAVHPEPEPVQNRVPRTKNLPQPHASHTRSSTVGASHLTSNISDLSTSSISSTSSSSGSSSSSSTSSSSSSSSSISSDSLSSSFSVHGLLPDSNISVLDRKLPF